MEGLSIAACHPGTHGWTRCRLRGSSLGSRDMVYSLAAVGAGRVAAGRSDGAVQVTSSITDLDEEEHGHETWTR